MKNFIAIAGNMGVGKSTLTKKLAGYFGWKAFLEPVAENPYLEDFYKDMKKWAFHSQIFFLGKRLNDHYKLTNEAESVIQDRSLYENAEVFAKNLYKRNYISKRDWEAYRRIYVTCAKILPAPDLIIYLKASPEKIIQRIKMRGRGFEKNVTLKYVKELNNLYDSWIGNFNLSEIITVNYDDMDFKYSEKDFGSLIEVIKQYLK